MKTFFVALLLAGYSFAGSLTITGPEPISFQDDVNDVKIMHRFFHDFADALKSNLTNSPRSELNGNWKMTIRLTHGSITIPAIQERMEIELTGGPYKPLSMTIPYFPVRDIKPLRLANLLGKTLWLYMSKGKIENVPDGISPAKVATITAQHPCWAVFMPYRFCGRAMIKSCTWIIFFSLSLSFSWLSSYGDFFKDKSQRRRMINLSCCCRIVSMK